MESSSSTTRTIVVTGCTRGLGRELVNGFARIGHRVIGCGRNAERIAELTAIHGVPHRFDRVDVGSDREVEAWASSVLSTGEAPDLVINNAALINRTAPLWRVPAEEFDGLTRVNLNGIASVVRHFAPAMIDRGRGVFANLSSGWGRSTSPGVAPYCTTKWGVEGLSRALADDLPAGLASVAVNPGIIDTDMLRVSFGETAGHYETPAEWAERAVPFFLGLSAADNGAALSI
ncbi:MAG: SDR family oxidoreductase [Planctomycetes bacterium]|nr:SDR family oxidoreductase [Planctomycetota bacterium]